MVNVALDETFSKYSSFETEHDNAHYLERLSYANTLVDKLHKSCLSRDRHESGLNWSDQNYMIQLGPYIQSEIRYKQIYFASCLYERVLVHQCLDSNLWSQYINFLIIYEKLDVLPLVLTRATRNVPYEAQIWALVLRAKLGMGHAVEEIEQVFQQGLSYVSAMGSTEQISLLLSTRLEVQGRLTDAQDEASLDVLKAVFKHAVNVLKTLPTPDTSFSVFKEMANIECYILKDSSRLQKTFEILLSKNAFYSNLWIIQ